MWTHRSAVGLTIVAAVFGACGTASARAPGVVASASGEARSGHSEPHRFVNGPLSAEPPQLSAELKAAIKATRSVPHPALSVPVLPGLRPQDYDQPGPETVVSGGALLGPSAAQEAATSAPGTFRLWRVKSAALTQFGDCGDGGLSGCQTIPEEPSVGVNRDVAFYTGNSYAGVSADAGLTWKYINPFDNFPADGVLDQPLGGICDQIVYYEPSRDLMFWLLQYPADANGNNFQRLAVADSREALLNNTWTVYDFRANDFGFSANQYWLDFPDLAVSSNYLYYTSNVFRIGDESSASSVIVRIPLDQLKAGGAINKTYYVADHGFRCVHGATDTMYWATHIYTTRIRIYHWPENSNTITSDDVDHPAYNLGSPISNPMVATSPDGTNFAGDADNRILAAYRSNGELGFMYVSAQNGGTFPYPYVDVGKYRESDRGYVTTEHIWSSTCAFLYPSVHTNDRGDKGGTIASGGGEVYPRSSAFIVDAFNNHSFSPLENVVFAQGTNGPSSNRWGDYLTCRKNWLQPQSWSGTGYVMTGPHDWQSDPQYVWFGREQDTPPADFAVTGVEVQGPLTYTAGAPIKVKVKIANFGAQTATVPLLDVRISADTIIDVGDASIASQPVTLVPEESTEIILTGTVPNIDCGHYYVGAFTPLYADGYIGNNSAFDPTPVSVCLSINQQPANQTIPACTPAAFSIVACGVGPLTYQWQHDGAPITDDPRVSGAHTATLNIASARFIDEGVYTCSVTDSCGTVVSQAALLSISASTLPVWVKRSPAHAPSPRYNYGLVYDTLRQKTVLVGGTDNQYNPSILFRDTWEWDGADWTQKATGGITPRRGASAAFDPVHGRTVVFGGDVYVNYQFAISQETWEWDGTSWTRTATSGPSPRAFAAMAFDPITEQVFLFGGYVGSGYYPADTWSYNTITHVWTLLNAQLPLAYVLSDALAMAYDPGRGRLVLCAEGYYEPTLHFYEWTGSAWTLVLNTNQSFQLNPPLSFDTDRDLWVLATGARNGRANLSTWVYRGVTAFQPYSFTQFLDSGPTPWRYLDWMVYDRDRKAHVLFGGYLPDTASASGDTWELISADIVQILEHPKSQPLTPGSNASFTVLAVGAGNLSYQWRLNGVLLNDGPAAGGGTISGAATPRLSIGNTQAADSGAYACLVSNACGSLSSNAALLGTLPADINGDSYVDAADVALLVACLTGPDIPYNPASLPPECTLTPDAQGHIAADVDRDGDVDQNDFAILQKCFSGAGRVADPHCAD